MLKIFNEVVQENIKEHKNIVEAIVHKVLLMLLMQVLLKNRKCHYPQKIIISGATFLQMN